MNMQHYRSSADRLPTATNASSTHADDITRPRAPALLSREELRRLVIELMG
jgi:hypothetical protein